MRDQWRRATAQAMAVLQWAPAATDDLVRHAEERVGRGRRQGPASRSWASPPASAPASSIKGDPKRIVGKASARPVTRKLTMPTGNKTRIVKVKTADEAAKTRITVRN